jgi:hypothetical protein
LDGSKYLDIAEKAIMARGTPLTGPQIIDFAETYDFLPYESYQTIVKTLQARLAEDISSNRANSRFVRTGIGRYYLRRLTSKSSVFGPIKWSHPRKPRRKPDHPNRILTVPREMAPRSGVVRAWNDVQSLLEAGRYDYQSEILADYIPVVCAVSLVWRKQIFSFKIGIHTHFTKLSGMQTVLIRKFLDEFDLDLFESDGTGATSATARAALPTLNKGPRARLENGKLSREEYLSFYQIADLLRYRAAYASDVSAALMMCSTIDLSEVYSSPPETQRRLEINASSWDLWTDPFRLEIDADARSYLRFIANAGGEA